MAQSWRRLGLQTSSSTNTVSFDHLFGLQSVACLSFVIFPMLFFLPGFLVVFVLAFLFMLRFLVVILLVTAVMVLVAAAVAVLVILVVFLFKSVLATLLGVRLFRDGVCHAVAVSLFFSSQEVTSFRALINHGLRLGPDRRLARPRLFRRGPFCRK